MNISAPFIRRPVGTTLLTLALALGGAVAAVRLPAAPMPEYEYPQIAVFAQMPGASPEVMATTVATPLERRLGAIPDVREISSSNSMGGTRVSLQFSLGRNLNGAARDVQAAINAARSDLPAALRSNPTLFKFSSAGWPITYLSLTSTTLTRSQIYEIAATVLQPKLASIQGVGQVEVLGSSPAAVRVELNPDALAKYGVDLETVRAGLAAANANSPKGVLDIGARRFQIYANDRTWKASDIEGLVVAYRNGQAIRLSDLAEVVDSVEDLRPFAITDREASILIRIYRTSGANVVETVDRIKARLEDVRAVLPSAIDVALVSDRTGTIRASLRDLEHALLFAASLIILVVFAFLRSLRATLVPAVGAAVSLLATGAVMYFMHYSLNNLSLMALIIATGLVVDDSVVVLENIARHIEHGTSRLQASLQGAGEVGTTVVAISLSLVAIFFPFLFMGDVIGRELAEFAVTLSAAILISLVVSLTTAPTLCALLLPTRDERREGFVSRAFDIGFRAMLRAYDRSLTFALRHARWTLVVFFAVLGLNVYLYVIVPKGVFPQQDPGRLWGVLRADQNASASVMRGKLERAAELILADPSVKSFAAVIEGTGSNSAELYVDLKPHPERTETPDEVRSRLTQRVREIAGTALNLVAPQDVGLSWPSSKGGAYQYDLRGDDIDELRSWALRLTEALRHVPQIREPTLAPAALGLETRLVVDRDKAQRLGITASQIDNALYDAFGQRQVSTIQESLVQHHIVMAVAPRYRQSPEILDTVYIGSAGAPVAGTQLSNAPAGAVALDRTRKGGGPIATVADDAARNQRLNAIAARTGGLASTSAAVSTTTGAMIPLSTIARFEQVSAPPFVNHIGNSAAMSINFDLSPGVALGDAMAAIERTKAEIHMPASIHSGYSGTAQVFQQLAIKEGLLILAALATIYIVLGILYESFIHPITILSTLPSAGVGAILALWTVHMEFTVIAFIGVILLIGVVKKNAIMMIDVALQSERDDGLVPREAIHHACLLRFRPIMMTTIAAIVSAAPLALGSGDGSELRQPLGISIIGGLIVSQALTLYTTPVVYLYLDRLRRRKILLPRNNPFA